MDDEDNGILNIEISDDEVDVAKNKADRTGQTEANFQAVKREYRVRVENGEIYKHVALPLQPGTNKMRTQELVHAVEELYFFRRYQEGVNLVKRALENGGAETLDNDSRRLLESYEKKCRQKMAKSG
ncbi:hypothetical protein J3458_005786 [Metarhizium acridum]|uniref:Uncharacterized protein n=1 Tax=Metarhizium acridum (strain CQMa 102) TaxID=655827 RepID=E9EAY2_METAQ|nr:uncharacterized protein MAC_07030 [Metarhizium acridum CQMa 102]EFY86913.1 hypothetical protein MAC_07030 [Metarhizium acridum CQMa 102]KAG8418367.1 hypothetical protein J3458_005786 [Metarhizium acridum]